jgi:hypothetical protein
MLKRLRPSPAMIVALIALFVALGGTAFAVQQINGSALKNRSVSHVKLQKSTITRAELNLKALGTLPKAAVANKATSATSATSADDANFAENSGKLDGQGPDFWQKACADGAVKGYAIVNGDTNFPSDYVSDSGNVPQKFNCTGGAVEAKRVSVGNYRVRFGGNTAAIAVSNSYGPGSFDEYVSVNQEDTGEWEVVIHNSSGEPTDHHFTILVG